MHRTICECKECKAAYKDGLHLHRRIEKSFVRGLGFVSDYVPLQRLKPGRARKDKRDYIAEGLADA